MSFDMEPREWLYKFMLILRIIQDFKTDSDVFNLLTAFVKHGSVM